MTGLFRNRTFRVIVSIAVAVALSQPELLALTESAAANAAIAGFASGAISSGNIKGALQGAFSASLFYGVGSFAGSLELSALMDSGFAENSNIWSEGGIGRVALHAVAGCV
ncbi:MAG: hypothetical protein DI537_48680, partial [Stutzerimonas stutzeri]